MRVISVLIFSLAATSFAAAQDFQPEFYAGVLGGASPSFRSDAKLWADDNQQVSLGAFAGVNLLQGSMLYGLEVAASHDLGKISNYEGRSQNNLQPYPRFRSSTSVPYTPFTTVTTGSVDGGQATSNVLTYSFDEIVARPSVSARIGIKTDSWTFFGKAGIGVSVINQTEVRDESASVFCEATSTQTTTGFGNSNTIDTGCIGPKPGPVTSTRTTLVTPNVIAGLGAEYAFDAYFARGEVEMTHVLNGGSIVRANAGLGIKF